MTLHSLTGSTSIELKINAKESIFDEIHISINGQDVAYSLTNDTIQINHPLDMGIHQLHLRIKDGSRIAIDDVFVNSSSLRQVLYMSYITTDAGEMLQPATTLWEKTQTWILPFGNPVSYWISLVSQKVAAQSLGQDLSKKYNIIYPAKIKLQGNCLPLVRDFFEHNFDFFCKPKDETNFLPLRKTNVDISGFDIQSVLDEIDANWQWIQDNQAEYSQKEYTDQTLPGLPSWTNLRIFIDDEFLFESDRLPVVQQLVKSLPVNGIKKAYIGILPPGSIIAPHVDNTGLAAPGSRGCNTLYIPLRWPPGNYFKFSSGGLIDSATPWLINISDHVHALINQSDQYRVILSVTLDPKQNLHLLA